MYSRSALARDSYTLASETWILGEQFLSAVPLCLIVTYHHRDYPTVPAQFCDHFILRFKSIGIGCTLCLHCVAVLTCDSIPTR